MHEGWDALPREYITRRTDHARGPHGYDPALPSMRALFVARGPAFRQGVEIPPSTTSTVNRCLPGFFAFPPPRMAAAFPPFLPRCRVCGRRPDCLGRWERLGAGPGFRWTGTRLEPRQ